MNSLYKIVRIFLSDGNKLHNVYIFEITALRALFLYVFHLVLEQKFFEVG